MPHNRSYTFLDICLMHVDQGVRTVFGAPVALRPYPAQKQDDGALSPEEQATSGQLMRVNHAGEVGAQALYQGQAVVARTPSVRAFMQTAANEEADHLAWCKQRLDELDTHSSYCNLLWYSGSFMIGVLSGLSGDTWSLGFLEETEHQVVTHLNKHLALLPKMDTKSAAILKQMREDEAHHAKEAKKMGAASLPWCIKKLMHCLSRVMVKVAYHI